MKKLSKGFVVKSLTMLKKNKKVNIFRLNKNILTLKNTTENLVNALKDKEKKKEKPVVDSLFDAWCIGCFIIIVIGMVVKP
jgi:hypothetical protein